MRPPKARLLEVAWGIGSAEDGLLRQQKSLLIELPDSHIPGPIQKITGLKDADLVNAISDEIIFNELRALPELQNIKTAIIHYSQFEKAFFSDLFFRYQNNSNLPFEILCSAQISKKLFPNLPSTNIRAVAGYFGASTELFKRSASHVSATFHIWKNVAEKLTDIGLNSVPAVQEWLSEKPQKKAKQKVVYEYRIEKLTRLSFPEEPGIYRMLNKKNDVLYVGKAKSLRSRVNSYFRGQKGRDRKKLEMLAQVWNIEFVQCSTPLEAALLENDEIKRHNPPYNIYLKEDRAQSVFYDRHFLTENQTQSTIHCMGPFRPKSSIETLRQLCQGLVLDEISPVFYEKIPQDLLQLGFLKFCLDLGVSCSSVCSVRDCLALGLKLIRQNKNKMELAGQEIHDDTEVTPIDEAEIPTVTGVSEKFERLFLRASKEYLKTRKLTQLLNCTVLWNDKEKNYSLNIARGKIKKDDHVDLIEASPWKCLNLTDYDRMSILFSELQKYDHKITRKC